MPLFRYARQSLVSNALSSGCSGERTTLQLTKLHIYRIDHLPDDVCDFVDRDGEHDPRTRQLDRRHRDGGAHGIPGRACQFDGLAKRIAGEPEYSLLGEGHCVTDLFRRPA